MKELTAVTELLFGSGEPMPGSNLTDNEATEYVRQRFPWAEYCLVRDWLWLDLEVSTAEHEMLTKTGRKPTIVYAHTVVFDSAHRWDIGDFVRTSPLHKFHDGFLFQTWSTVYVLLGPGQRKTAALETVGRIF